MNTLNNNTVKNNVKNGLYLGLGLGALCLGALPGAAAAGKPALATDARPAVAVSQTYVLSPDDQLNISVQGHEDLTTAVTILSDGTFNYPQVGAVHAAGLTVAALTRLLAQGLSDTINQPEVNVSVKASLPRRVSVLGAVHAPGQYDVKPDSRVLDILAAAGGPAQDANLTDATLVSAGGTKTTSLDVDALMKSADSAQNLPLAPGDVLLLQAREAYQVQVTGEVAKTGTFLVPKEGMPILTLLSRAGGPLPDAAMTQAQILHDGKARTVNLRPLTHDLNDPIGEVKLMPGDVLQVPATTLKVALLGNVNRPGAYDVPDGETLPITKALILASGTAGDADLKNATLLRRSPEGTPILLPVNLALLLSGKEKDTVMQPGDILYVPALGPAKQKLTVLQALSFLPFVSLLRHF